MSSCSQTQPVINRKNRKKWIWLGSLSGIFCLTCLGVIAGLLSLRPTLTDGWQPLYEGVDLQVSRIPRHWGQGRMMAVRVKWDTPNLEMTHRLPDFSIDPDAWQKSEGDRLFKLEMADWALNRQKPSVFVNTTRYTPHQIWRSIPGQPVTTLETLVIDGQASHRHAHSYILWWDQSGEAHMEMTKPPSEESLTAGLLGIGIQGVSVAEGKPRIRAMSPLPEPIPRTFIGIDNANKNLYLIAFEEISDLGMLEMAIALGVKDGGMVDSGDATHLLIGENAKDIKPHTGIRNRRPLAGYLMIFAEPLP